MTGLNFVPVLRGENVSPREFVFGMREPHGSVVFTEDTTASGYDLGRSVRDDRYKLILNYTPWMRYAPVDSANDPGWKAVVAAHEAHTLGPSFERFYFASPRPIEEVYDLQADPFELNNLAGKPEVTTATLRLKIALQERMMVDYDFLPLPLRQ